MINYYLATNSRSVVLLVGSSGSVKTSASPNRIKQQSDDDYNIIDEIYLYVKEPNETEY